MALDRRSASALLVVALSACGPYSKAARLERKGDGLAAAGAYLEAARSRPADARAPEALWAAGRLFAEAGRCDDALVALEDLARLQPEPWRSRAKRRMLECPDFMPMQAGWSWTYGDSATGGSNMRQEARVEAAAESGGVLELKTFAGKKHFSTMKKDIRKLDWRIEEVEGEGSTVVLRFPFREGTAWSSSRGGREVRFRIDDSSATVEVQGGRFSGCLKVREQIEGFSSWAYVYYAPGVGRVLTSAAGPGFETRNAELLKYERPKSQG